jgi:hypothetical protein
MDLDLRIHCAEALFASDLSQDGVPDGAEVTDAVDTSWRKYGGRPGCAAVLATEFGDHPETAVGRMRWALGVVRRVYP